MWTSNDFRNLLGNINWLWPTIVLTTQEVGNLFKTLQSGKNLNHSRKLSCEAEKELALREKQTL